MANLTTEQADKALKHLGYNHAHPRRTQIRMDLLAVDFPEPVIARVAAINRHLDSMDSQISASVAQAQVTKIGSMEFQYNKLIANQRSESARQQAELGNLLALAVVYAKYGAARVGAVVIDY